MATRTDRTEPVTLDAEPLGSWRLARPIGHGAVGARFMAFHAESAEPALAYRVDRRLIAHRARAALATITPGTMPVHQHILTPLESHRDAAGDLWLIAPFVGSARGLLTVEHLASARDGGLIGRPEAAFAGLQLLSAAAHSHALGFVHGPIDGSQVLVHPRGSLLIELYGTVHRLRDLPAATDADRAEETRSIVSLVSRLVFGAHPASGAGSLEQWVQRGLQSDGYASARDAHEALDAAMPGICAARAAGGSWARDLVGIVGWTLTRR